MYYNNNLSNLILTQNEMRFYNKVDFINIEINGSNLSENIEWNVYNFLLYLCEIKNKKFQL